MELILDKSSVKITEDGLMKIDGVPMFRKIVRHGVIYIQFCDKDRMRSNCRGTRLVEIKLDILLLAIQGEENGSK
jgi:hypothetical protein